MSAWAEYDAHLMRVKKIIRAHDVINARDLEIDVLNPRPVGWEQGNTVMYRIE